MERIFHCNRGKLSGPYLMTGRMPAYRRRGRALIQRRHQPAIAATLGIRRTWPADAPGGKPDPACNIGSTKSKIPWAVTVRGVHSREAFPKRVCLNGGFSL